MDQRGGNESINIIIHGSNRFSLSHTKQCVSLYERHSYFFSYSYHYVPSFCLSIVIVDFNLSFPFDKKISIWKYTIYIHIIAIIRICVIVRYVCCRYFYPTSYRCMQNRNDMNVSSCEIKRFSLKWENIWIFKVSLLLVNCKINKINAEDSSSLPCSALSPLDSRTLWTNTTLEHL